MLSVVPAAMAAPPPNDELAGAIDFSSEPLPYTSTVDTTEATTPTDEVAPSCTYSDGRSVWYRYTAPADGYLKADIGSSYYATGIAAYTGSAPSAGTEVACNASKLNFKVRGGETYTILVRDGYSGSVSLTASEGVAPPANDDFAAAKVIDRLSFSDTVDMTYATKEDADPIPSCNYATGSTVWYSYTPSADGYVQAETPGSYYSALAVYTGSPGSFDQVACDQSHVNFKVHAGVTYYFMVRDQYGYTAGLTFTASDGVPPPPNDDFADARSFDVPSTDSVNAKYATAESDDPSPTCQYAGGATAWYTHTATADGWVELDTSASGYSNAVAVYTGSRGSLNEVACDSGYPVRFHATAGTRYYVMVRDLYGYSGDLTFTARTTDPPPAAPANDELTGAKAISTLPFSDSVATAGATKAADDPSPNCSYGAGAGSVWYSYRSAAAKWLRASTEGSGYDTSISVWTGSPGALTQAGCMDAYGGGEKLRFEAKANTTYYVMVAGGDRHQLGALSFAVQQVPPPNPNCDGDEATIVGTERNDTIVGTAGDDVIVGLGGNDKIDGGGGNDVICGERDDYAGKVYGNDTINGGAGSDIIRGDELTFFGNGGMHGGNGNDTIDGGAGYDSIDAGGGNDVVHGGADSDDISDLAGGNDRFYGGDGSDYITDDGGGSNVFDGGAGRDTLRGDADHAADRGNNAYNGGDGDDGIIDQDGNAVVFGGAGNDYISTDAGNDAVSGGDGDDNIVTRGGNDTLAGGAGDDRLDAGDGNDWLVGGKGLDWGDGGLGRDGCREVEDKVNCEF
jgi:Ca2+-binding RTX toxin-like protein